MGTSRTRRLPANRPIVEPLENRRLFNVSSVFNVNRHLETYIVHQNGTLTHTEDGGAEQLIATRPGVGVRVVHAFLAPNHRVALDVVYDDGQAWEYTSSSAVQVANNALDMAHAITASGDFRLDVLISNSSTYSPGPDQTGTLYTNTPAGTTAGATNVRWVSDYIDVNGNLGTAMGVISGGNLIASRTDSTGTFALYNAPDAATQDVQACVQGMCQVCGQ